MINITIYEDGNGGQLYNKNNDLATTQSLNTLVYLALFSGNIEESTVRDNIIGELNNDWWGNDRNSLSSTWINSETERILRGIELNSSSLYEIEQAVKQDTKKLQEYGTVNIDIEIIGINKVKISVNIEQPGRKNPRLELIWDNTRNEIIEYITL